MRTNGHHVRVTEEAHRALTKKAEDSGFSMKDFASATIINGVRRGRDNKRYAVGTFIQGAIAGGVLIFFIGMVI